MRKEGASAICGLPEQDLVMAGYIALAGSAAMVRWDKETLEKRLPEELLQDVIRMDEQMGEKKALLTEKFLLEAGAFAWFPVAVGGVFNALWHMADEWGTGFTVQLKELPVRQETIEICELEEKNPYYTWSANCLLIAADHGSRLCDELKAQGIPAAVIGVLTDKKDKTLVHDSTVSCLNRPREDELNVFMNEHGVDVLGLGL